MMKYEYDEQQKPLCPKCGNKKVSFYPGGSRYRSQKNVKWICGKCREEF